MVKCTNSISLSLEIHRSTRVVLCTQVSLSSVIINNICLLLRIFFTMLRRTTYVVRDAYY